MNLVLRIRILFWTLLLLCVPFSASAQTPKFVAVTPPALTAQDAEAWLDGLMIQGLRSGDLAGAVVTIVKDGQTLISKGYGYADVATKKPVDAATTLFRPGSVSKLITWTAAMQLVEQGKLDLDQDINKYLDFTIPPREGKPVTLRNLMTHTPGFEEDFKDLLVFDEKYMLSLGHALKRWIPKRVFAPGKVPAYSNYGASLTGYIVERVSGQPFDQYVQEHIFKPLGMSNSSFSQPLPKPLNGQMATTYDRASDPAKRFEIISMAPAGSLSASGSDMGRFMLAHLQDGRLGDAQILQPSTSQLMHNYEFRTTPGAMPMALGFYREDRNGQVIIAHGGDTSYFHSDLKLFPKQHIGLFVSIDGVGKDRAVGSLRAAVSDGFVDRYFPLQPRESQAKSILPTAREHGKKVVGDYLSSRGPVSSWMYVMNVISPLQVRMNKEAELEMMALLPSDTGKPTRYFEVEPFVWQEVDGVNRIYFDMDGDRVRHLAVDPYSPIMIFFPATFWQSVGGNKSLIFSALAVLLAAALLWPVAALVRRSCHKPIGLSPQALRWYRASRTAALLQVLFVAGYATFLINMFEIHGAFLNWSQYLIQFVGILGTIGVIAAMGNAFYAWRDQGGWWRKLNSTVLALAYLLVVVITLSLHVLKPGTNY